MPKKVDQKEDAEKIETAARFGGWLRAVRESAGLSIEEAARKAGLSRETWTVAELGGRNVFGTWRPAPRTPKTLRKMAEVLDVPEAEVLRRAGVPVRDDMWIPEGTPAAAQMADLTVVLSEVLSEMRAIRSETAGLRAEIDQLKGSGEDVPPKRASPRRPRT